MGTKVEGVENSLPPKFNWSVLFFVPIQPLKNWVSLGWMGSIPRKESNVPFESRCTNFFGWTNT